MATLLDITRSDHGGATVLTASGEIDLASAPDLERHIEESDGAGHLVIDLLGITFVDSTGLRVLIMADRRAKERGGRLTLVAAPGPVTRLLDLTGVDQHLRVRDSLDGALAED